MKFMALQWDENDDLLASETCEEGLNFLAYVIREDIAEGRPIDAMELEGMRRVATELLILVARWLGQVSSPSRVPASTKTLEQRATRLFDVMRTVVHPETAPRDLAEALQSVADLIRSTRRLGIEKRIAIAN
jgi:hypothetical protein